MTRPLIFAIAVLVGGCGLSLPDHAPGTLPIGFGTDGKSIVHLQDGRFAWEGDRLRANYNAGP